MKQVFLKELKLYFGSPMAYIVVAIFLIATTMLIWFLPSYQNVLDTEFANLEGLFTNAPLLFLWLIPALCMHLFAEEYRSQKSVLLFTRPLTSWAIIGGKYLAALSVVLLALLPTLLFVVSLYYLANPVGAIDTGAILGSYIGLLLLAILYLSISLFSSAITNNQLIAFLVGVLCCGFAYKGWSYLASLFVLPRIQNMLISCSIEEHYRSIARGVIDSRDVVFFILLSSFFLLLTHFIIKNKR